MSPSDNGQMAGEIQQANNINADINSDLKSPISLVYEIALKRNLNVTFEVMSEKVINKRSIHVSTSTMKHFYTFVPPTITVVFLGSPAHEGFHNSMSRG